MAHLSSALKEARPGHLSYLPAPFQQKGSLQPCAPVEEAGDEGVPQLRDFVCADPRALRLKRVWIQVVHRLAACFTSSMSTQVPPHQCTAQPASPLRSNGRQHDKRSIVRKLTVL